MIFFSGLTINKDLIDHVDAVTQIQNNLPDLLGELFRSAADTHVQPQVPQQPDMGRHGRQIARVRDAAPADGRPS